MPIFSIDRYMSDRQTNESKSVDVMKLSHEDNQESLDMEMLQSETFLLETEYVNMEQDRDNDWTDL